MKTIRIGSVEIPLDDYVIGGTAVLGIRDSGKTVLTKGIAEQLLDHQVPPIIFDAIGVWRHMKRAGDGPRGKAYKIVVAGGIEPDLPLTPGNAAEIVRAAIRENIPLVIDLYDKKLSKSDWRRIVQTSFRTLLYENTGLRHIILEEAAEYAPQKVMDGETYAEVEKVVRMGGNASLGITLINQRAQEVNKAILDLCENMVLMRQRGAHAIDSLEKWMDRLAPDQARMVSKELPSMKSGDCWVFTGASEAPTRTRSEMCRSFHPDRRKPEAKRSTRAAADTTDFVNRLSSDLAKVVEEAKANDPKVLRAEIADLRRKMNGQTFVTSEDPDKAYQRGYGVGFKAGEDSGLRHASRLFSEPVLVATHSMRNKLQVMVSEIEEIERVVRVSPPKTDGARVENPVRRVQPAPPRGSPQGSQTGTALAGARARQIDARAPSDTSLGKCERAILTALAQSNGSATKSKVAVITGYASTGGGFNNAISALRSKGFIEQGEPVRLTDAGAAAVGDVPPLPAGDALLDHWIRQLGKAEAAALKVIFEAYPNYIEKETVADAAGYEASGGGFNNALSKLRTLELIEGRGAMRASEAFFS